MNTKMVTCRACGWVHMGVSRAYAEDEVKRFNEFFEILSQEKKDLYYGGKNATIETYEKCFCCGGSWKDFREYVEGDCPRGVTIQPIQIFDESLLLASEEQEQPPQAQV